VKSLNRSGLLVTLARELARFELHLVHVQDKGSNIRTGDYTVFFGIGNENHPVGTEVFVNQGIVSAAKRVKFVSDRIPYIGLRGHWYNIIVLNAHAPTEEKSDDSKHRIYEELEQVFDHFPKYHMKILLGHFNEKVEREDIFKPKIKSESLRQDSNDNGVGVVSFPRINKLIVKNTMFPHRNIHTYTRTSPDGNTHNQTHHILIYKRRHSSVLDVDL
jgi:hypothetical protein